MGNFYRGVIKYKGKKAVELICFQLEKKTLQDFDKSADSKDYDRMKVTHNLCLKLNKKKDVFQSVIRV